MTPQTAIVILGAAVREDGPSPALQRRTRHGAELFKAGIGQPIICCGGLVDHPPSEAEAMRSLLIAEGVPDQFILCEPHSTTTYENLRNAKALVDQKGISRIVIVTDGYHGPRARMVARAHGLDASCNAPASSKVAFARRLRRIRHEALALLFYRIRLRSWIKRDQRDQNWLRNIT